MKYNSILFSCLLGGMSILSTNAFAGGAIGGDCCADLEERVAELEATTVRKGNTRVSLRISGNVHRAILFTEDDTTIIDTAQSQTKFQLAGKARISNDLYAGYRLEFGVQDAVTGATLAIRHNDLYIGSKTLGKLSIGHGSTSSDYSGEVDLSGTQYVSGGSLSHYNILGNLDGFSRKERIRYDTPTLAGFKLSASWQETGDWDAAISYAGSLGDFTVAGKVAYYEIGSDIMYDDDQDENTPDVLAANDGDGGVTGSLSILHRPSGISLTAAAGDVDDAQLIATSNITEQFWYVKAGLQRRFFAAGKTKLAVDYHNIDTVYEGVEVDKIGVHLVQDIDAAAMKMYVSAWNAESDLEDLEQTAVMVGATINF